MAKRRHKWKTSANADYVTCEVCGMHRRRPQSRIRRGRPSVSDWDYWIDREWVRLSTVPPCKEET